MPKIRTNWPLAAKPRRKLIGAISKPTPRLKEAKLLYSTKVSSSLIDSIEIWRGLKGFYVYYRYPDQHICLATGPHIRESTALRHAQNLKKALES